MEANKQIRYIMVTHSDGSLMASTFTDGLPMGLPVLRVPDGEEDIDLMSFSSNEGTIKEIMVPIDDGYIGYIRLGLTEKYMLSSLQERFLVVVLMVILVCAVAATLTTRYAHEFLRPVARLSFAVKQMDKGNYGIQVPVDSKDEIGRLASTFNKMSTGLRNVVDKNNRLLEDLQLKEQNRRWLIEQLLPPERMNSGVYPESFTMKAVNLWPPFLPICGCFMTGLPQMSSGKCCLKSGS